MQIISIAAVADNQVIGHAGDIPWRIPADWERFKERTTGNFVVMGRRTFESIGTPLPNRTTIVVTNTEGYEVPAAVGATRVLVASSVEEAIHMATTDRWTAKDHTIFIAGGGDIYAQAMPLCTGLDITEVHQTPEGDTHFPEIDPARWYEVSRESHDGYDYVRYAEIIHTPRLELRPATMADLDDWFLLHSDPKAYPFAPDSRITSKEEAAEQLEMVTEGWRTAGLCYWLARLTETGELIGAGGMRRFKLPNGDPAWKLYFRLIPAKVGNGYSHELTRASVEQLARLEPLARVRALMRTNNEPSIKVAENLGLKRFGTTTENGPEQYIYQGVARELI